MNDSTAPRRHQAIDYQAAVKSVIALVRQAAQQQVMPRFLRVQKQTKHDGSPFSEADLASERFLATRLPKILKGPVIGEEMPQDVQMSAWNAGQQGLWCIDPIDGTTNFINGLPLFAISVAWLVDGKPQLGVTYNPVSDEMFYAVTGGGAFLNEQRLPLRKPADDIRQGLACIDSKHSTRTLSSRVATASPFFSQRNLGSSTLEWCYLAAGRFDLYLHGGQKLWDYAAGQIILNESGGQCCTLENDDFNATSPWQRSVVAALHPKVFSVWRDWLRDENSGDETN